MTAFEPRILGIKSDHSTNCTTTPALVYVYDWPKCVRHYINICPYAYFCAKVFVIVYLFAIPFFKI